MPSTEARDTGRVIVVSLVTFRLTSVDPRSTSPKMTPCSVSPSRVELNCTENGPSSVIGVVASIPMRSSPKTFCSGATHTRAP